MYVVKSKDGIVLESTSFRECVCWMVAKSAEYESNRVNWLSGPGLDILSLVVAGQQWTLSDTRDLYVWAVMVDGQCLGVFAYLGDAMHSVEMTWGKAICTHPSESPADTVLFACSRASGKLQRILYGKKATQL